MHLNGAFASLQDRMEEKAAASRTRRKSCTQWDEFWGPRRLGGAGLCSNSEWRTCGAAPGQLGQPRTLEPVDWAGPGGGLYQKKPFSPHPCQPTLPAVPRAPPPCSVCPGVSHPVCLRHHHILAAGWGAHWSGSQEPSCVEHGRHPGLCLPRLGEGLDPAGPHILCLYPGLGFVGQLGLWPPCMWPGGPVCTSQQLDRHTRADCPFLR